MSVRKRAAGAATSPDLDTPDPVKKRKKNDVRHFPALDLVGSPRLFMVLVITRRLASWFATVGNSIDNPQWHVVELYKR